jgi:hypothetical protein
MRCCCVALNPLSRKELVGSLASKGASTARPARLREGHWTCRVVVSINPLQDRSMGFGRTPMRSAGSSLLRIHYATNACRNYYVSQNNLACAVGGATCRSLLRTCNGAEVGPSPCHLATTQAYSVLFNPRHRTP